MKAVIIKKTDDRIIVDITGSNFETINSIRRSCMNNVPTLAVEDVQIFSNNSALYDEVLAHRLGLIPLTTDLKTYVKSGDCKCKGAGCARCTAELSLDAKGPVTVMSKDLISSDKNVKPVFGDIPIIKLFENQEVKLLAKAKLNTGDYHSKHAPCTAYYQYYPIVKVLKKKKKALDDICPRKVFKDGDVDKKNLLNCNLCMACVNAFPDSVSVEPNDERILLTVESWGQLKPKEIYNTAVNNLIDELNLFSKELK